MIRRKLCPLALLAALAAGCSGSSPQPASTERFISVEEWRKMPPEERNDPYVLQRLKTERQTKAVKGR